MKSIVIVFMLLMLVQPVPAADCDMDKSPTVIEQSKQRCHGEPLESEPPTQACDNCQAACAVPVNGLYSPERLFSFSPPTGHVIEHSGDSVLPGFHDAPLRPPALS